MKGWVFVSGISLEKHISFFLCGGKSPIENCKSEHSLLHMCLQFMDFFYCEGYYKFLVTQSHW